MAASIVAAIIILDFVLLPSVHSQEKPDWLLHQLNDRELVGLAHDTVHKNFKQTIAQLVLRMTEFKRLHTFLDVDESELGRLLKSLVKMDRWQFE